MATPAEFSHDWHEILAQYERLSQFKNRLPDAVKMWLDACEWTLIAEAGQLQVPLLVLRAPGRLQLRNPMLLELAENAHKNCGPIDLSIFSGESQEPIRVLSQTLVDISRHQ